MSHKVQNALKTLSTLPDSELAEYIDYKKLIYSSLFNDACTQAAEHCEKHGNPVYLMTLIKIFPSKKHREMAIYWACARLGFRCTLTGVAIRFKKNGVPSAGYGFKDFLNDIATPGYQLPDGVIVKERANKAVQDQKYTDALDSWARLPGSHGRG